MITEPDASGGLGSYSRDLWGILTGALNVVAAPALGQLLDINTTSTVGADGQVRHAATPSAPAPAPSALSNPLVIVGLIVGVVLLVVVVRK